MGVLDNLRYNSRRLEVKVLHRKPGKSEDYLPDFTTTKATVIENRLGP